MSKIIRKVAQVQDSDSVDYADGEDLEFNMPEEEEYQEEFDDQREVELRDFDEEAQAKLEKLCGSYVIMSDKLKKLKETSKKLKSVTDAYMEEIESMLNIHGIKEYSHGELKFYIDNVQKKKQLKKDDMKKAIEEIVQDKHTVDEIYKEFEQRTQVVDKTQVKCTKRGKK